MFCRNYKPDRGYIFSLIGSRSRSDTDRIYIRSRSPRSCDLRQMASIQYKKVYGTLLITHSSASNLINDTAKS
jgi:hypothetical protein